MTHNDDGLGRWFGRDADTEPTQQIESTHHVESTQRVDERHEPTLVLPDDRDAGQDRDSGAYAPDWPVPGAQHAWSQQAWSQQAYDQHSVYAPQPVQPQHQAYGQASYGQQHPPVQQAHGQQAYGQGYPTQSPPAAIGEERRPKGRVLPSVMASSIVALLVGGAAGYGGATLAGQPALGRTGAPTSAPTIVRPPVPPAQGQADTVAVADRVLPSTVTIAYGGGGRSGTGSGFVIDRSGHIMTNNHVVEGAPNGRVTIQLQDGTRRPATVVGRSPSYDLAVVRTEGNDLPPVDLGDSAAVRPGQPVVAVGAPLGLGGSVTAGIVSAVERPLSVGNQAGTDDAVAYINGIQIDAPINPGNSGGPLADGAGRIIGVNSAILTVGGASQDAQQGNIGLGFAIPINQAAEIGQQLISRGKASFPVIGATVSGDQTAVGVRLSAVNPGQPADRAGLAAGDLVEAVDGRLVRTSTEFIVRIRSHRPGDVVTLRVAGRGDVGVTLGGKDG